MTRKKLNIRFHNPNSNEEIIKFLVKVIAQQKADELLKNQVHIQEPQK